MKAAFFQISITDKFKCDINLSFTLQGKTIRCSLSDSKHRLFIGNVPKSWTEDEFKRLIEGVGPGVEHIELIKVELQIYTFFLSRNSIVLRRYVLSSV